MSEKNVAFTPVDTGNMSKIPPAAPAGAWNAVLAVKKSKTAADGFPMLIIEAKLVEALTDGNESSIGSTVAEFVTFFPASHKASRMSKMRFAQICNAVNIEIPAVGNLASWEPLQEFIDAIEGVSVPVWTILKERKDTGEVVTNLAWVEPGGKLLPMKPADDDDDDGADEKPKKPAAKKGAKKR